MAFYRFLLFCHIHTLIHKVELIISFLIFDEKIFQAP